MESWCNETANENSLLSLDNYYSVHQTKNNKKRGSICIYIHKQLEFKLRNDIDIFNYEIEVQKCCFYWRLATTKRRYKGV